MGIKSVLYGVATDILVGAIAYGINIFLQKTKDEETKIFGLAGLVTAATLAVYAFVWKWSNVRSWSFYSMYCILFPVVFVPLFLASSFDLMVTLDKWREPNSLFLTEFVRAQDPHVHNIIATVFECIDGIVLHAISLMALWRLGDGSERNVLDLWILCFYFWTTLAYCYKDYSCCFAYLAVASTFWSIEPRSFTLSHNEGSGKVAKLLALITLPSLVAAAAVIVAKGLVLNGVRNEHLDFVRLNDPLIALNDVEKTFPYIAALIWQNVIVSLPLLFIFLIYHLKSSKPTLLWELSIINFALALVTQLAFFGGSFYWKTPKNLQANPTNLNFWAINLLPVTAALLQIVNLLPFRVSLVSVKAKAKKRS